MFESCPLLFQHTHILKTVKFVENEAMKNGKDKHKKLERNVIRAVSQQPQVGDDVLHVAPIISAFVAQHPGIMVEEEVTLNRKLNPTGWFDKDAWIRAKMDLVGEVNPTSKLPDRVLSILDWKTGQVRETPDQLRLYNMVAMLRWDRTQSVTSAFVFVDHKKCSAPVTNYRPELQSLVNEFCDRAEAIQIAYERGTWPATKNFQCRWCGVTTCKYITR